MNRDDEISFQISQAVGPSPWYWSTFPEIHTSSGETLKWSFMGTEGNMAYVVGLASIKADTFKLLLNTYTRAFFIPPHFIGVWFPNGKRVQIQCFNPDALKDFELNSEILEYKKTKQPYYCNGEMVCEIIIESNICCGIMEIDVPSQFETLNELLTIRSSPIDSNEAYTILSLNFNDKIIKVYPQKWFTADKFDLDYQWITRITRDKDTGRFIGDGIRIGKFELCDDGMNLLRWI